VGAGTGALIGKKMDKVKAEAEQQLENATVEEVTDANGLKAVKITFSSGILFALNKSDLNATSKTELANFSNVLKNNSTCSVEIQGYTDSTGNDGINIPLSQSRADAVTNYLKSCGVSADQITKSVGYGSSNPVASNDTKDGQAQNRRVEVYLYASEEMIEAANNGTLQ
ncbi:MAG: OmpA family protein, partial [Prevotellaceae bacterium]|nr:OmpA family protein [Prevotellaceae bacterium]